MSATFFVPRPAATLRDDPRRFMGKSRAASPSVGSMVSPVQISRRLTQTTRLMNSERCIRPDTVSVQAPSCCRASSRSSIGYLPIPQLVSFFRHFVLSDRAPALGIHHVWLYRDEEQGAAASGTTSHARGGSASRNITST